MDGIHSPRSSLSLAFAMPTAMIQMSRSRSAGVMRHPLIAETVEKVYRAATGADSDDD